MSLVGSNKAPGSKETSDRLKVFVSYSRVDLGFADQIVALLRDQGFEPQIDRHSIDPAENWRERLGALIAGSYCVVVVHSDTSAQSEICSWEVAEAVRLQKRLVPVVPQATSAPAHPDLRALNFIYFYDEPTSPGTGFYEGQKSLVLALKRDIEWARAYGKLLGLAKAWNDYDRSSHMLLKDKHLENALAIYHSTPEGERVSEIVHSYIKACSAMDATRGQASVPTVYADRKFPSVFSDVPGRSLPSVFSDLPSVGELKAARAARRTLTLWVLVLVGLLIAAVTALISVVLRGAGVDF